MPRVLVVLSIKVHNTSIMVFERILPITCYWLLEYNLAFSHKLHGQQHCCLHCWVVVTFRAPIWVRWHFYACHMTIQLNHLSHGNHPRSNENCQWSNRPTILDLCISAMLNIGFCYGALVNLDWLLRLCRTERLFLLLMCIISWRCTSAVVPTCRPPHCKAV
jgi:hypothetical protein